MDLKNKYFDHINNKLPYLIIQIPVMIIIILYLSKEITYSKENRISVKSVKNFLTIAENEIKGVGGNNPVEFMDSVMKIEKSAVSIHKIDKKILIAESNTNDNGIRFESGYYLTNNDFGTTKQKLYGGVSWELLEEGFFENRSKIKQKLYQKKINIKRELKEYNFNQFNYRDHYIISYFNELKYNLLKRRIQLLVDYYKHIRVAYFLGEIYANELFKVESQIIKVRSELRNYNLHRYDEKTVNLKNRGFKKLISFDLNSVVKTIDKDPLYTELSELSEKIENEKYNNWNEKRLKFYIHTGISETDGEYDSGNLKVGVYFKTPIFSDNKKILSLKIAKERAKLRIERENTINNIIILSNNYKRKFSEAIELYHQIRTHSEKLRRAIIKLEEGKIQTGFYGFDKYLNVKKLLQELMDEKCAFIDVQENMYRRLLKIFTLSGLKWNAKLLKVVDPELDFKRGRKGKRAVYIWSKDFNKYSNEFLTRAFIAKEIKRVIISGSKNLNYRKLKKFIRTAKENKISVELMISVNSWVRPEKWERVKRKLTFLLGFSNNIHLDIEPHVLHDFKKNREKYKKYFLNLICKISKRMGGDGKLYISLPAIYRSEFINIINNSVDGIYIMAYGTKKSKTISIRISSFKEVPKEKLVFALRPGDFSSELEIEMFIDNITENNGFSSFAFHEFNQFYKLLGK
ncbi:MAG: hypothetical protein GY714_25270 [Desulfobacterales bacterium]|nr:hypothetical protein [Desulfobacterales bacterium]